MPHNNKTMPHFPTPADAKMLLADRFMLYADAKMEYADRFMLLADAKMKYADRKMTFSIFLSAYSPFASIIEY